jgi:transposase InsO family protein/transposase
MKRIHFPRTTAQQRELLFETWEATGDVDEACRRAHVCRQTFYDWKPRFDAGGYAALENFASSAPHNPSHTSVEIEQEVINLRRANPTWGKRRIADEVAKHHNWERQVSPNTVRRILVTAGSWDDATAEKTASFPPPAVRVAEEPDQTVHIDLAFIPATHETAVELPAVSGSSGRLVVERLVENEETPTYPGQVFANPELEYAEAMNAFVAASQADAALVESSPQANESATVKEQRRALRRAEEQLRAERRVVREQRRQEDKAWRTARSQSSTASNDVETGAAANSTTSELRQQRKAQLERRKQEDAVWRQHRTELRQQLADLPIVTAWIAVLVIVDSCSRQCLGLPLFSAGAHVTAEMIVAALEMLLPADLQFLVSDRGVHFRSKVFAAFAHRMGFVHVLTARHRPQSNGFAERFVRTLKEWLASRSWQTEAELAELIAQFLAEYNDRPHQGLPIPGLSPNEFAKRLAVL